MTELTIPAEGTYSQVELNWIDSEPPGLLASDQTSYWGQARKVFADYLQVILDDLALWFVSLDPSNVSVAELHNWETMLGIPVDETKTLAARRNFLTARHERGPFTRTRRRKIVESFIAATFGVAIAFDSSGVAFSVGGVPFFSGSDSLVGSYAIFEEIANFSYEVRILDTVDVDIVGLTRELDRITPDGITFTIVSTSDVFAGFGTGTFGSGLYGE